MSNIEKKIEQSIIDYFKKRTDSHVYKIHGGSQYQRAGIPDLLACVNGHFVAIEVKRPKGGIVSALQEENIRLINQAGGVAFVATSLDEVKFELVRNHIIEPDS